MTFGQQPQNNGQYNPQYNTPDYNAAQQSGYGQQYAQSGYGQNYYAQPQGAPTYQYVPQGTGAGAGAATINTTMTYNYEEARLFDCIDMSNKYYHCKHPIPLSRI